MSAKHISVKVATSQGIQAIESKGKRVGPFLVHQQKEISGFLFKGWTITHVATGYTACSDIPNKHSAVHAAKRLSELPVSWEFDSHLAVKEWPETVKQQIVVIRVAAKSGGEA